MATLRVLRTEQQHALPGHPRPRGRPRVHVPHITLPLPLDQIPRVINPVQSADLTAMLEATLPARRFGVALAFADTTYDRVALLAGLPQRSVHQWTTYRYRMPFGGAVRLARVFGVAPELLFEYCIRVFGQ